MQAATSVWALQYYVPSINKLSTTMATRRRPLPCHTAVQPVSATSVSQWQRQCVYVSCPRWRHKQMLSCCYCCCWSVTSLVLRHLQQHTNEPAVCSIDLRRRDWSLVGTDTSPKLAITRCSIATGCHKQAPRSNTKPSSSSSSHIRSHSLTPHSNTALIYELRSGNAKGEIYPYS